MKTRAQRLQLTSGRYISTRLLHISLDRYRLAWVCRAEKKAFARESEQGTLSA